MHEPEADKEIDRNLREHNQALEKQVRALSDQLSELERDVADRISRSDHLLREEIKQKNRKHSDANGENVFRSQQRQDRTEIFWLACLSRLQNA